MFPIPDGRIFPVKTIFITDQIGLRCFVCNKLLSNNDILYYCQELKKYSCWDCNQKDALPCKKYIANFHGHIDILGELHIVEPTEIDNHE